MHGRTSKKVARKKSVSTKRATRRKGRKTTIADVSASKIRVATKRTSRSIRKKIAPKCKRATRSKGKKPAVIMASASKTRFLNKTSYQTLRKKVTPKGYSRTDSGILVPSEFVEPVPSSKLLSGLNKATKALKELVKQLGLSRLDNYLISQLELAISFDAQGKFMGFGVGGAATNTIRLVPDNQ